MLSPSYIPSIGIKLFSPPARARKRGKIINLSTGIMSLSIRQHPESEQNCRKQKQFCFIPWTNIVSGHIVRGQKSASLSILQRVEL